MAKEIFIVRHGQTDYNLKRIVQGRGVNSHLNDTGRQQAKAFFNYFKTTPLDAIYASNLIRTYQTVQNFEQLGYKISKHPELDEIDWGIHEGKRPSKAQKTEFRHVVTQWTKGEIHLSTPKGESPYEVHVRLQQFLQFLRQQQHEKVLICTHGRTTRILLCTLLNQELSKMDLYPHQNTSLAKLYLNGNDYKLAFFNQRPHLTDLSIG